ncbi:MAG: diacylglycerol/lipid kinase family protein [Solirubrobacteraceae bacterium]
MPPIESLEHLADAFAALERPVERKRMLVIVNPYATTVSDRLKNLVIYALQGRYEVDTMDTEGRDHATVLCREAAQEGYDVVVAFGGDGTVNEAANGLVHSPTPLTCLPGGATNVYCKMLGVPGDIVDATEHLLRLADDWVPRPVDLAHVNGRGFTFSAGYGLDASVVRRVDAHPRLKARLKQWYFAYAAVGTFTREYVVRPPRLEAHVGGEVLRGVTALVQNADPYTYFGTRPIHVAEGVALDDGAIGGVMLERAAPVDIPTVTARLLSDRLRLARHKRISAFTTSEEMRIFSADGRPVALQVDGDYIGDTAEAVFGVWPGALTVIA